MLGQANALMDEVLGVLPDLPGAGDNVIKALERGQEHLFENWKERGAIYRETLVK